MADSRDKYVPRVGECVRVVLEGEVASVSPDCFWLRSGDYWTITIPPGARYVVSVEPIEPPVEVFGPGDTVRRRGSRNLYSIGNGGYFHHVVGKWVPSGIIFTSKHYEPVILP